VVPCFGVGYGARAQVPETSLAFSGPGDVLGEGGATVDFDLTAELTTTGISSPDGIEGWSIGIAGTGCEIIAGTTAGTAGASASSGGLRQLDGFEKTLFPPGSRSRRRSATAIHGRARAARASSPRLRISTRSGFEAVSSFAM